MILPIYVYGQPVLRKVAEDIAPDYPNLKELMRICLKRWTMLKVWDLLHRK